MKILMVSIFGPHFFNWTQQLENSGHEVYWLDVFDSNTYVEKIGFVHQIIGWRYKWDYPGRYFVKRHVPKLNKLVNTFNERKLAAVFEEKLQEIKPDVVHSFVMYLSVVPILKVMKKHPEIKWIYSAWGSDLYYYRKREKELMEMKNAFPYIDYMFSDCNRDHKIAVENGLTGKFLGVFPGGGGYNLKMLDINIQDFNDRKTILIKGYQGLHGRCLTVLKAISRFYEELKQYKIVIFGTNKEVFEFLKTSGLKDWENLVVFEKIPHSEVVKLMGESLLYIGNSKSDGIPNTLLEAIVMGAFPIQSNPGGATAELIEHGKNGLLIENAENVPEIRGLLEMVFSGKVDLKAGIDYNLKNLKPDLEREKIREKVLGKYEMIARRIS